MIIFIVIVLGIIAIVVYLAVKGNISSASASIGVGAALSNTYSGVNQTLNDLFEGSTTIGAIDPITGAYASPL